MSAFEVRSICTSGEESAASEEEDNGEVFTDADFGDSDSEVENVVRAADSIVADVPVHETVNEGLRAHENINGGISLNGDVSLNGVHHSQEKVKGLRPRVERVDSRDTVDETERRDSQSSLIVGIIGKEHCHAEARLAARRAARAEAREIRMRELERQQREQDENADKAYDMHTEVSLTTRRVVGEPRGLHSPRRSSHDSMEDGLNNRDIRNELKEFEEKFRKAMILNAQLDNDKSFLSYQLELLKDKMEDLQEQHSQLQREHRKKCSAFERVRREAEAAQSELVEAAEALTALANELAARGLVLVKAPPERRPGEPLDPNARPTYAILTDDSNQLLESAGEGTLDVRLQKLNSDKRALESEVRQLKIQLEEERYKAQGSTNGPLNGTNYDDYDSERETAKRLASDYKYRACKAEQEVALLGAACARLEGQVARHKAAADRAEQAEDELKGDKRRLQREAREALNRVEELETENSHLSKRLDKLKNAKSTLLKEL